MVGRVSTFQYFQTGLNNILRLSSQANEQYIHLSAQKRVINAGDDPVAMNSILNFNREVVLSGQYRNNITLANQRLSQEETALIGVERVLFRIKELVLQGNSGVLSGNDRQAIAREIEQRFNELVDIANTTDQSGEYIFAGFLTGTKPFSQITGNVVNYLGDRGQREIKIGSAVNVTTSDSGDDVFLNIANPYGDFRPTYTLSTIGDSITTIDALEIDYIDRVHVTLAEIADRGNYLPIATAASLDTYRINFLDSNADEIIELQVLDSTSAIIFPPGASSGTIENYEPGMTITFNDIQVSLDGQNPQVGDSILLSPQDKLSLFDAIKDAIDWLESPNASTTEKATNYLLAGTVLDHLDAAQIHNDSIRAVIGARMQLLDTQDQYLVDYDLILRTAQSDLEDLEVLEAISAVNQTVIVLQAAQGTFSQLQNLSLFDYIV